VPARPAWEAPPPAPDPPKVSDLDAAANALFRAVKDNNLRLKNDEIAGLISRDPDVMAQVQAKVEAAEAAA
jgi:hypothetical protein